jgi:hypothetical protein
MDKEDSVQITLNTLQSQLAKKHVLAAVEVELERKKEIDDYKEEIARLKAVITAYEAILKGETK